MESPFMKPSSSLSNSMLSTSSGVGQSGIYHRRGPPKSSTISSTSSTKIAQKVAKLARKRRKKDSGNKNAKCSLLYHKLNKGVASGALNRINKVQLKILNTGLINIDEEGEKASGIIPGKPFDLSKPRFRDHVKLLHKYMVLLKIEFHVSIPLFHWKMLNLIPSENMHMYVCMYSISGKRLICKEILDLDSMK